MVEPYMTYYGVHHNKAWDHTYIIKWKNVQSSSLEEAMVIHVLHNPEEGLHVEFEHEQQAGHDQSVETWNDSPLSIQVWYNPGNWWSWM